MPYISIRTSAFSALLLTCLLALPGIAGAEEVIVEPVEALSSEELQDLVAPIALYPDDLVAIVLPASTYPLQIVAASRYREQADADRSSEPDETWDESVVALLNYPEALALLNDDLDWTWSLGQAVATQQPDVLAAISEFRLAAIEAGNLASDEYQIVTVNDNIVTIKRREEEVVYVPYYDPEVVTVRHVRRVYHYYPTPYPVYYYPYHFGHHYYDHHLFWGVSSIFLLSWSDYHLYHHLHSHHLHPYYRFTYHRHHFHRTYRYHTRSAYERRHHRHHRYVEGSAWRPNREFAGARPYHPRHRSGDRLERRRIHRRAEYDRQREYTQQLDRNTQQSISSRDFQRTQRPGDRVRTSVHRDAGRELRLSQRRSDARRPVERRQRVERQNRRQAQTQARVPERRGQLQREQRRAIKQAAPRVNRESRREIPREIRRETRRAPRHNARPAENHRRQQLARSAPRVRPESRPQTRALAPSRAAPQRSERSRPRQAQRAPGRSQRANERSGRKMHHNGRRHIAN